MAVWGSVAEAAAGYPDDPDVPAEQRLSRLEGAVQGLISSHYDLRDAVARMLDRMGRVELHGAVRLEDVGVRGRAAGRQRGRGVGSGVRGPVP